MSNEDYCPNYCGYGEKCKAGECSCPNGVYDSDCSLVTEEIGLNTGFKKTSFLTKTFTFFRITNAAQSANYTLKFKLQASRLPSFAFFPLSGPLNQNFITGLNAYSYIEGFEF
jgi:hypothetical protein